ncbi:serine hydrolase domain-containing protein [Ornithinimicrobium panacihumi]|uniref:serine hydrolase domain-containing protein n=1 Tax=Ornithinimicrobium panacihumi TaxID=2008449 RepID=UPI003F8C90E8
MGGAALQEWLETELAGRLERVSQRRVLGRRASGGRGPALPPPQVLVRAPGVRFTYGDIEQPFHTASIGKNFLAVLIGRLVSSGHLSLDAPLGSVLPSEVLTPLPALEGVDLPREVTVARLLGHRSGLPDPFLPPRGHRTECSLRALADDPGRAWTLEELVAQCEGLPAVGRPGEKFRYSDAGFALLSLVAEQAGGAPVHDLLRREVFEPAGMADTYQVLPPVPGERTGRDAAPMWLGRAEVSQVPALTIGSVDGGAITTADDLVRFQEALHGGALLDPDLLAHLARPRSRMRPGIHYGLGFVTLRFEGFMPIVLRGLPEPVGGLGLTAAHAFYYPDHDAHVVLNYHSTREMNRSFEAHIAVARALGRVS